MRGERLKVLYKIDQLDKKRCKKCTYENINRDMDKSCECKASKAIMELGDKLIAMSFKKRFPKVKIGADIAGMSLDKLTPGLYLEMRRQGKSDRYVYQTLKVTGLTFRAWRDKNMAGYEYD